MFALRSRGDRFLAAMARVCLEALLSMARLNMGVCSDPTNLPSWQLNSPYIGEILVQRVAKAT
jgi:hypothetical protein